MPKSLRASSQITRSTRGFSILELTIAMAILAFGMLGMAAAQIQALNQGSRGRHTTAASTIAQWNYEQILRQPYSGASLQPTAGYVALPWINPAPPLAPGDVATVVTRGDDTTANEIVFNATYRIQADAGLPPNPDIRLLDLRVTWTEELSGLKQIDFAGILVNNDY